MLAPALEIVEALRELEIAEDGVPSLFVLALHARVCHLTEDHAARRLMDEAVTRAGDDDDLRQDLVNSCGTSAGGRGGGVRRGRAETSRVRVGTPPSTSTCRSRMHAKSVAEHVDEWLTAAAGDPLEAGPPGWLELMAYENAWLLAHARHAGDDGAPHAEEDNVLAARGRPGDVAGGGRDGPGLVHARYGLWQVRPGAEPRDRVHGRVLPGASSTSRSRRIRSWTCRDGRPDGPVVPLDGARRAGAMTQLAPDEADVLCVTVRSAPEALVSGLLDGTPAPVEPLPFERAEPHRFTRPRTTRRNPRPLPSSSMPSRTSSGGSRPACRRRGRRRRVSLTPTASPLGLITARVGVRDARALAARLAAHPDFEPAPDEEGHYLELGQQVPAAQRGAMVAEVRAQVRAEGKDPEVVVDRDGSQWWARGRLHLRGSEASVEVDSRARLAGLMDDLAATGGEPAVVEQSRITPGRISRGPRPRALGKRARRPCRRGLGAAVAGRGGAGPARSYAPGGRGPAERHLLEGLLRRFEYDADVLAAPGVAGSTPTGCVLSSKWTTSEPHGHVQR